jgi:hypothetical protein
MLLRTNSLIGYFVNNKTPTPVKFWMCGKQKALSRVFLEVWQGKELAEIKEVLEVKEAETHSLRVESFCSMVPRRGERRIDRWLRVTKHINIIITSCQACT